MPCRDVWHTQGPGDTGYCTLAQPWTPAHWTIPAGSVVWLAGGKRRLLRVTLGQDTEFKGLKLPSGSEMFFHDDGRLHHFWLSRETVLQGHRVRAQDDGAGNLVYDQGALRAVWLVDDEVIDGVPCTSSGNVLRMGLSVLSLGTQRMAWFYEDGRLRQAMLARDATIQGHNFHKGEVISLDAQGRVDLRAAKLSDW